MKPLVLLVALALLPGCNVVSRPAGHAPAELSAGPNTSAARGERFVRNRCADCHSVDHGETSPLPAAPSFAAIANTPGLTRSTLATWLNNHRNFPEEMYFEVPAEHVDDITEYILTLRQRTPAS